MRVPATFKVIEIKEYGWTTSRTVVLEQLTQFSLPGRIEAVIHDPADLASLQIGTTFFLELSPVEAPTQEMNRPTNPAASAEPPKEPSMEDTEVQTPEATPESPAPDAQSTPIESATEPAQQELINDATGTPAIDSTSDAPETQSSAEPAAAAAEETERDTA